MPTRRQFLALLGSGVVVAGAVVGISRLPAGTQLGNTPTIQYGHERCAYCTMSIDDARFAAAWRTPDGQERHFDDIGCMVNAYRRERPAVSWQQWVHDYRDENWLDAGTAAYVIAPTIKTPMAYGVAAFASPTAASATMPAAPAALTWTDVLGALERKG